MQANLSRTDGKALFVNSPMNVSKTSVQANK